MDKDLILKIIGELYLNNHLLSQKNSALAEEVIKLKALIGQLSDGQSG